MKVVSLIITILIAFAPALAGHNAADAQKKEFIDLLKTLPTKGEFYAEDAIRKAGPYLPVLLSLTERDTEKFACTHSQPSAPDSRVIRRTVRMCSGTLPISDTRN